MNSPKGHTYIFIILLGVLLLAIIASWNRKPPLSWEESYSRQDKIPYGTYILFDRLPDLFQGRTPVVIEESPYSYFNYGEREEDIYGELSYDSLPFVPALEMVEEASYLFINQDFTPDRESMHLLLDFVANGNQVFIASESMDSDLEDTLGIQLHPYFWMDEEFGDDTVGVPIQEMGLRGYLSWTDSQRVEILAKNSQGRTQFARIPFGEGNFFLCATPLAFTNYYLLDSTLHQDFVSRALSFIPEHHEVLWDAYYKNGNERRRQLAAHPLQFIYSQPSLKWAFFLTLTSLLIFLVFESKRKRPLIPMKEPLPNTSMEFIETIGRLYFQRGNHKHLLEKKIRILLSEIYSQYGIATDSIDEAFQQRLATKTGQPPTSFQQGILAIKRIRSLSHIEEKEFITLYRELEKFSSLVLN